MESAMPCSDHRCCIYKIGFRFIPGGKSNFDFYDISSVKNSSHVDVDVCDDDALPRPLSRIHTPGRGRERERPTLSECSQSPLNNLKKTVSFCLSWSSKLLKNLSSKMSSSHTNTNPNSEALHTHTHPMLMLPNALCQQLSILLDSLNAIISW